MTFPSKKPVQHFNRYRDTAKRRTQDWGESLTVEGDNYTIREIYQKALAKMDLSPLAKEANYDPDADFDTELRLRSPDFDLADLDELAEEARETLDQVAKAKKAWEEQQNSDQVEEEEEPIKEPDNE